MFTEIRTYKMYSKLDFKWVDNVDMSNDVLNTFKISIFWWNEWMFWKKLYKADDTVFENL